MFLHQRLQWKAAAGVEGQHKTVGIRWDRHFGGLSVASNGEMEIKSRNILWFEIVSLWRSSSISSVFVSLILLVCCSGRGLIFFFQKRKADQFQMKYVHNAETENNVTWSTQRRKLDVTRCVFLWIYVHCFGTINTRVHHFLNEINNGRTFYF